MLTHIPAEEFATVLDATIDEILAKTGVSEPPVDALHIAQLLNLAVAWDGRQASRARMVHLTQDRPDSFHGAILLRPEPRAERRQWSVAHEIGEELAERVFQVLSIDPAETPHSREQVANLLASRLLLPTEWFHSAGRACDWDLFALKDHFPTASHELLARRMLDAAPPIIVTIFDHGRLTWRKSNLPGSVPSLSPTERESWTSAHRTGNIIFLDSHPVSIRAWPIHEPNWKREILRTEIFWME